MRVLIVDDHQVVRAGVRALLEADPELEVCGEGIDGLDVIAKAHELLPYAVVMDVSMPNLSGIEATCELVLLYRQLRVVMLSQHDFPHIVQQALNAGAYAYVVKSATHTDLLTALKEKTASGRVSIYGSTRTDQRQYEEILQRSSALESALRESE